MMFLSFFTTYFKQILIAVAVIAAISFGWYIYRSIQAAAIQQYEIQRLNSEIKQKEDLIDFLHQSQEKAAVIAKQRQDQIDNLNQKLDDLSKGLGVNEDAPESIKEYFRRLQNVK